MPRLLHWLFDRSARPRRRRRRPGRPQAAGLPQYAEVLEERTLLSAALDGSGLLTILSTGQDDAIRESAKPDAGDDHVSLAGPSSAQPPAGDEPFSILPYPGFVGGVRVAAGDINDDGTPDIIVAAGPGGGPHVKVFDGTTGSELRSFLAFDPGFTGGVFVAASDINNDSFDDIIVAADAGAGGGPHVKVFDGATGLELSSFFAFDPGFTGGVRVAAGDVNGDTFIDIITSPGPGGGPHVRVFDGLSGEQVRSFFAFDPSFSGGVFVAAGDVDGDGPHLSHVAGADELELAIFGGDALGELFTLLDGGKGLDTGPATPDVLVNGR